MSDLPVLYVIVDFQNDFVSGSLAVPNAEDTLSAIIQVGKAVEEAGGQVVLSRDWHPHDHMSFASDTNPDGWPVHCEQNTWGGEIHPAILEAFPNALIFSKGFNPDEEQYSAFFAVNLDSADQYTLAEYARTVGFSEIITAGLALDFCVKETTFDFWGAGYSTTLVIDGTRPVFWESGAQALLQIGHYDQGELFARVSDEVVEWVLGP